MCYGWIIVAGFGGAFLGVIGTAFLAWNRDKPLINPDTVAAWLLRMELKEMEKTMIHLVRRCYHDKKHLHRNPRQKSDIVTSDGLESKDAYDFGKEI